MRDTKKILCIHYDSGRCTKGDDCEYSHRSVPVDQSRNCPWHEPRQASNNAASQAPCKFWVKGGCRNGDECRFRHVDNPRTDVWPDRNTLKSELPTTQTLLINMPCKFFTRGSCRKGTACLFSHDVLEADLRTGKNAAGSAHASGHSPDRSTHDFGSTKAIFGPGAIITQLILPMDSSSIRILGLRR